jgi:uncharacterized protein YcbK (DUF882 family)
VADLSPHFAADEFRSRDGVPLPLAHRRRLRRLCLTYLEPARVVWGPCTVISGHRSAFHNTRVGGAPQSFHLALAGRDGAAADVCFRNGTPADWYRTLDGLGAPGLGLYATHVHVDTRPWRARW